MTINFNNPVILNDVIGTRTNKNCKQVIDLDNGNVYASVLDAADANEVSVSTMSSCCSGRLRTVKGKHFAYASHASENLDMLASRVRTMTANQSGLKQKATAYDVMMKVISNVNKRRVDFEKAKVELEEAERELSALLEGGNVNV